MAEFTMVFKDHENGVSIGIVTTGIFPPGMEYETNEKINANIVFKAVEDWCASKGIVLRDFTKTETKR